MAAYILIPGAGGAGSYWSRVAPLLREAGHDVVAVNLPGADPAAGLPADQQDEGDAVFATPCTFSGWPERVRVLAGADDRFFPADFQDRVAKERLGVDPDIRPGGHLIALAQPAIVAEYLLSGR